MSQRVRRFHAFRGLQGEWIWQGIGRVWAGSLHRGQIYRHSHPKEDQLETTAPPQSETNLGTNEQLNSFLPIFFKSSPTKTLFAIAMQIRNFYYSKYASITEL